MNKYVGKSSEISFKDQYSVRIIIHIHLYSAKVTLRHKPSLFHQYCQTSNISRTVIGNKLVDHSDVVGASPVGANSTIRHSRLNTWIQWIGKGKLQDETRGFSDYLRCYLRITEYIHVYCGTTDIICAWATHMPREFCCQRFGCVQHFDKKNHRNLLRLVPMKI